MSAIKWQDWPVMLPEQAGKASAHSAAPHPAYSAGNTMLVLRRLLQDLLSEQLLPFQVLAKQDDRICFEIMAQDKEGRAIAYHCHGRLSPSFWQVRLCEESVLRVCSSGQRPAASIQEFIREVCAAGGLCELAMARHAREIEIHIQAERAAPHSSMRRNPALQNVLLLDGETALPFADLRRMDADGEPMIADWLLEYGTANWINALLEASLQPMIHLLYGHGIGIEACARNMVLLHRQGLPCRVALKELPTGLHLASNFSACAGPEPRLAGSPQLAGEGSAAQVLSEFYSAMMVRNFGQLSLFLREHFGYQELHFWQQVANCIYRYQDARPAMAMRFASFDLFAAEITVDSKLRADLLSAEQSRHQVRNPLHRFRRA